MVGRLVFIIGWLMDGTIFYVLVTFTVWYIQAKQELWKVPATFEVSSIFPDDRLQGL